MTLNCRVVTSPVPSWAQSVVQVGIKREHNTITHIIIMNTKEFKKFVEAIASSLNVSVKELAAGFAAFVSDSSDSKEEALV